MLQAEAYETLAKIITQLGKMADDTHTFMWAVRRSLIMQSVMIAGLGTLTLLNGWVLYRVTHTLHEVIKLVRELIDEQTK